MRPLRQVSAPLGRTGSQILEHILVGGGDLEHESGYLSSFSLCFKGGE